MRELAKKVKLIKILGFKLFRVMNSLLGLALGISLFYQLAPFINRFVDIPAGYISPISIGYYLFGGLFSGLIFFLLAPLFFRFIKKTVERTENKLINVSTGDLVLVAMAFTVTLVIALLVSYFLHRIPVVGVLLAPLVSLFVVFTGVKFAWARRNDFSFLSSLFKRGSSEHENNGETYKILDTSTIIDGRIVDICKSGFLEGVIVVAGFVLAELQHIADSSDLLKRNRGRRGLDVLNTIQKDLIIPVKIDETDYDDLNGVDNKLIRLAKELRGKIITNDNNLYKVCRLQDVAVLSIGDLAHAVKPLVATGEEMLVQVVKEGKETGQGLAYLDDGTMIVVENGRSLIGDTISVVVTTILQTSSGRMIFARPAETPEEIAT